MLVVSLDKVDIKQVEDNTVLVHQLLMRCMHHDTVISHVQTLDNIKTIT